MYTNQAIERVKALEKERAQKREQALASLKKKIQEERNQKYAERALKAWEERRANGTATLSDEAKNNIRIGMRDNHNGKKLVAERLKRLEAKLLTLGYSIEEIRSM